MTIEEIMRVFVVPYGFRFMGAFLIFAGGVILSRWLGTILDRGLQKNQLEPPIRLLIVRLARLLVILLTLVIALDKLSVQVAPLVTGIGVAGVGLGLAMQGVLSNMVAGLTIIFTKPFRVGQYIEVAGVHGQVMMIELTSTKLSHVDMSTVIVPNRKIVGEIVHNYGEIRQADLRVGIAYGTDVPNAMRLIREILEQNPKVLQNPAPIVGISKLDDSAIVIAVMPWTRLADFCPVQGEIYQKILEVFKVRGVEIPFPQREIRMLSGA